VTAFAVTGVFFWYVGQLALVKLRFDGICNIHDHIGGAADSLAHGLTSLENSNCPSGIPGSAGSEPEHITLAGKLLNDILTGRQRRPGLNADIGSLGLGPMPESDIRHIGV